MASLSESSPFQLIVLVVFVALAIIGIIFFALFRPGGSAFPAANLTAWGFVEEREFRLWVNDSGLRDEANITFNYVQKNQEGFKDELTRAIATESGPDMFFLPDRQINEYIDLIRVIPFSDNWLSRGQFREVFVEQARLYELSGGLAGVPISIDPLVTFWNRDIVSAAGIAGLPDFWEDMDAFAPRVARTDGVRVERAAFALGEYRNIDHAKLIISALIMQTGGDVIWRDGGGVFRSGLGESFGASVLPARSALSFYTDFSNPNSLRYTWSRTLPNSREYFATGNSALYFGLVSDVDRILAVNPNLDFGIRPLPQLRAGGREVVSGEMMALAIARGKSPARTEATFRAIRFLTSAPTASIWADISGLPPARRGLLASPPADVLYSDIFYDAAVRSRSWFDPESAETDRVLQEMVESITGGRRSVSEAVGWANQQILELIERRLR